MSLFDDAMGAAAAASGAVMGEPVTINAVVVTGTVGDADKGGGYDRERAGRVARHQFTVHLTLANAALCTAIKGSKVVTARGLKGKVESISDLGAGGIVLSIGESNQEA